MGQSASQPLEQSRIAVPKISQLQFWKQSSDIRYGDIKVYKLNDGHAVAVKDHIFQDEEQWNTFKLSSEKQLTQKGKDMFLIEMMDLQHVTEKELCTQLTQAHSVYEYFDEYLERVINELALSKQYFEEIEIVAMIHCTLVALQKLNEQQKSHGDIRPLTISVTSFAKKSPYRQNEHFAVYKLTDIQELTDMNAFRRCVAKQQGSYNLSPEQLSFLKQRVLRPNYDLNKSDVFSIGLTALQMATLNSIQDIYEQQNYSINIEKLDSHIYEMKTQYSEQLCSIVCQLLSLAPENRPTSVQGHELLAPFRFQLEDYFRMSTIADYLPNYSIDFRQTSDKKEQVMNIHQNMDTAELFEQMEIIEQRAKVALQRSQDAQLRYQKTPGKQSRVTVSNWEPTRSYQQYNNLTPITQKELHILDNSGIEKQSNRQSNFFVKNLVGSQYPNQEINQFNEQVYHADEEYMYNQQEQEAKPKQSVVEQVVLTNSNLKQIQSKPNANINSASFSNQQLFESINTDKPDTQINNNQAYSAYRRTVQQSSYQNQIESKRLTENEQKLSQDVERDREIRQQLTGQDNFNNPALRTDSFGQNYSQQQAIITDPQNIYPQNEYSKQQSPYVPEQEQQNKFKRQLTGSSDSQPGASINNSRPQSSTQINAGIKIAESQIQQTPQQRRSIIPKQPNMSNQNIGSKKSFQQ